MHVSSNLPADDCVNLLTIVLSLSWSYLVIYNGLIISVEKIQEGYIPNIEIKLNSLLITINILCVGREALITLQSENRSNVLYTIIKVIL